MRIRRMGLAAAVWGALTLAAAAWGGDGKADADPSALRVGARRQVELKPVRTGWTERVTVYQGVVARASGEGVGLIVTEERTSVALRSPLAHAPVLSRLFRNVGIGRPAPGVKKEVWLPIATIHAITAAKSAE